MKYIDLHVHSDKSDGTLSPAEVTACAAAANLAAFALTDHDNMDGIPEAMAAAEQYGIELVPGIEFSTEYCGTDIHLTGLDLDYRDEEFLRQVQFYRDERLRRNEKMILCMARDGIDISWQKMVEAFGDTVWTRAHFARYLADHGLVSDMKEAFGGWIGEGCRYFIPREKPDPATVVRLIRRHHGIPVLAHPFQYRFSDQQLRALLSSLKEAGLIGMEVYYSSYTEEQQAYLLSLVQAFDLLPGGGSDFHGTNKPKISIGSGTGSLHIPRSVLENLRQRRKTQDSDTKPQPDIPGTAVASGKLTSEESRTPLCRKENPMTFRERFMRQEAVFDEIFELTEQWNFSDDPRTLREFLGLTEEEEDVWISDSDEALEALMLQERQKQTQTKEQEH